jgi:hypothetical protein
MSRQMSRYMSALPALLCAVQVKRARFETLREFVGGQRLADEPPLDVVASHLGEQGALRFRFDALGHQFEIQCLSEAHDSANDCLIVPGG